MTTRREIVLAGVGSSLLAAAPAVRAQATTWPEMPVKIIVPFTAGNAADILTRMVAEAMV